MNRHVSHETRSLPSRVRSGERGKARDNVESHRDERGRS